MNFIRLKERILNGHGSSPLKFVAITLTVSLLGCGQKGDLYLPSQAPSAQAVVEEAAKPASKPTSEQEKKQKAAEQTDAETE